MKLLAKNFWIGLLSLLMALCAFGLVCTAQPAVQAEEGDAVDITARVRLSDWGTYWSTDTTAIYILLDPDQGAAAETLNKGGYINDNPGTFAVDLCQYISIGVNGVEKTAREWIQDNQAAGENAYSGTKFPMNAAAAFNPVLVYAPDGADHIQVFILNAFAAQGEFTVRLKAGFQVSMGGGERVLSEDIVYGYVDSSSGKAWIRMYDVTWDVDGLRTSELVPAGTTPSFTGSTDKAASADTVYTFTGWDAEPVPAAGHVTYTAQYSQSTRQYDVTFGSAAPVKADYGSLIEKPADPVKDSTATKTYAFDRWVLAGTDTAWNFETDTVTGDVVLEAVFTEADRYYTVTFEGSEPQTVLYEGLLTEPETPAKAETAEYTYTFDGWYNGDVKWDFAADQVTADGIALVPRFTSTAKTYTVRYQTEDGEELKADATVAFGTEVDLTAPAEIPEGKAFEGWYLDGERVNGLTMPAEDVVLVGRFADAAAAYTVSYQSEDGEQLKADATVEVGGEVDLTAPAEIPEGKVFDGWYLDGEKVTSLTVTDGDIVLIGKFVDKVADSCEEGSCSSSVGVAGMLLFGLAAAFIAKRRF